MNTSIVRRFVQYMPNSNDTSTAASATTTFAIALSSHPLLDKNNGILLLFPANGNIHLALHAAIRGYFHLTLPAIKTLITKAHSYLMHPGDEAAGASLLTSSAWSLRDKKSTIVSFTK
jgi:hypothetical protein